MTDIDKDTLVREILESRKYRGMGILESTVRDLLARELAVQRTPKLAVDEVRKKLHNIIAPYLGDPDYTAAAASLDKAFATETETAVRTACSEILAKHASTRERLPNTGTFYQEIFKRTGKPAVILDLACGLNPLAFPWMGLPTTTRYYAYDLHRPRLGLINHYFRLQGLEESGICQDVLIEPPQLTARVAFLFKEAHRMEQRQRGCSLPFWSALRVDYLLVSLPARNLTGKHDLAEKQRRLVYGIADCAQNESWQIDEFTVGNEIVFCIKK